jgi:hypothetical protein
MGRHANQQAWAEFERLDRKRQEESLDPTAPLTDEELEQIASDEYWERLDAVRRYARPNCHVSLMDEMGVGR